MASGQDCPHGQTCFVLSCSNQHPNNICSNPHDCVIFECKDRHSKQRPRVCSKVNSGTGCPFGQKCTFLHPGKPTQANKVVNAAPESRILKLTGFAATTDITAVESRLKQYFMQLGQSVATVVTVPAAQPAYALLFCQDPAAAQTTLQLIEASPKGLWLGQLHVQLHRPAAASQQAIASCNGQAHSSGLDGGASSKVF